MTNKEFTMTYEVTFEGKTTRYTDTYEAFDARDAHYMVQSHWYGAKVEFIETKEA